MKALKTVAVALGITLGALVGPARVISGVGPALLIVSLLLWYPFAFKTHEGYSTGPAEARSHNYYGAFMYWFSLGLSMHREHHMRPSLTWIELRRLVERSPRSCEIVNESLSRIFASFAIAWSISTSERPSD